MTMVGVRPASLGMSAVDAYVARVVAEAPPLTPEQRDRLAGLLGLDGGLDPNSTGSLQMRRDHDKGMCACSDCG